MPALLNNVQIWNGRRYVVATVDGARYEIPEAWLMGICRGMEVIDALHFWHEQEIMQREFEAQHA